MNPNVVPDRVRFASSPDKAQSDLPQDLPDLGGHSLIAVRLIDRVRQLFIDRASLQDRSTEQQLQYVLEQLKALNIMSPDATLDQLQRYFQVYVANVRALAEQLNRKLRLFHASIHEYAGVEHG